MSKDVLRWVYLLVLSLIWGVHIFLLKKDWLVCLPSSGVIRILMTTGILLVVGHRHLRSIRREQWKWLAFTGFRDFLPFFSLCLFRNEIDSSIAAVLNGLACIHIGYFGRCLWPTSFAGRHLE